ncbi:MULTISPECIES: hypothetical protein [Streptacidiphilus]|uniref:Uncharacterized protein n=1 Tax=Streptacidiphilus cavernicola TaxID=3342716 RepID=A0ABV6UWF5_9ACTN|nr:hypothetical protein [Streptacidiphilus jeojiense]
MTMNRRTWIAAAVLLALVPSVSAADAAPRTRAQQIDLRINAGAAYGVVGLAVTREGRGFRLRGNLINSSDAVRAGEYDGDDCVELVAQEMYFGLGTTGNSVAKLCHYGDVYIDRRTSHSSIRLVAHDQRRGDSAESRIVTLTG